MSCTQASSTTNQMTSDAVTVEMNHQVYSEESQLTSSSGCEAAPTGSADAAAVGEAALVDDPAASTQQPADMDSDSDASDISGLNWKSTAGSVCWVQRQIGSGVDPRDVLQALRPGIKSIPAHVDDITLWKVIIEILSEPPRRERLRHISRLDDVIRLIRSAHNILVLTGAGVSVSCGIPDFRSRDGIYARLAVDFPNLPDPQAMFDINYFRKDPRPFFKFAKEIYPGQFEPSLCHRFIALLEKQGKLLRNYTQNIDTLEQQAGISSVIQCHGSFATASCQRCRYRVTSDQVRDDIFHQRIPLCPRCQPSPPAALPSSVDLPSSADLPSSSTPLVDALPSVTSSDDVTAPEAANEVGQQIGVSSSAGVSSPPAPLAAIMKPDIVFFGEGLSDEFHNSMEQDKDRCDLLIVIGSSLKVRPVALIPSSVKRDVAQVLINREPLPHLNCDVELLGDCDVIVDHLCRLLGGPFESLCRRPLQNELTRLPLPTTPSTCRSAMASTTAVSTTPSLSNPSTAISSTTASAPTCRTAPSEGLPPKADASGGDPDPCPSSSSGEAAEAAVEAPAPDPTSEEDLEALRSCWQRKITASVSALLPENTYLFQPPCRHVFSGAEVFFDPDEQPDDDDDDVSSSSSTSSSSAGAEVPSSAAFASHTMEPRIMRAVGDTSAPSSHCTSRSAPEGDNALGIAGEEGSSSGDSAVSKNSKRPLAVCGSDPAGVGEVQVHLNGSRDDVKRSRGLGDSADRS